MRACVIAYLQHRPACFNSGENSSELWIVIVSVLQEKRKKNSRVVGHSSDGVTISTLNNKSYNKHANIPHAFRRPFASNGGMPTLFESNPTTTKDSGLSTLSCSVPRQKPEGRKKDR